MAHDLTSFLEHTQVADVLPNYLFIVTHCSISLIFFSYRPSGSELHHWQNTQAGHLAKSY